MNNQPITPSQKKAGQESSKVKGHIHCARRISSNTRPHQLHWGDWEIGTAIMHINIGSFNYITCIVEINPIGPNTVTCNLLIASAPLMLPW